MDREICVRGDRGLVGLPMTLTVRAHDAGKHRFAISVKGQYLPWKGCCSSLRTKRLRLPTLDQQYGSEILPFDLDVNAPACRCADRPGGCEKVVNAAQRLSSVA